MAKYSLDKSKIKVLLLEGLHPNTMNYFQKAGYSNIENLKNALEGEELAEKLKDVHILGIRSRTLVTAEILAKAPKLITIGAFCIGTNQINCPAAKTFGIPVFNAPYSNTRSVAELVIAEIIMLMRGIPAKSKWAKEGKWIKSAKDSYEIRGKKLGIIGYGHIGSQISILAEAMGMQVYFYDIIKQLPLGNAKECQSLDDLLALSDVISLHVPSTPLTRNMIGDEQLAKMKKGACLINASRGDVVDYHAVAKYMKNEHLVGVAADVFPQEPSSAHEPFHNELQQFDNVILTPHIGGSTLEAQANIGIEVAEKLVNYSNIGTTLSSVNFMQVSLMPNVGKQRFLHIHKNVPGILKEINYIFTSKGINISAQYLQTDPEIGYVIIDTDSEIDNGIIKELKAIKHTIKARMLY